MVIVAHAIRVRAAKAARRIKAALSRWLDRFAEQQMRKVRFQIELHRDIPRNSSRGGDDLPIAR